MVFRDKATARDSGRRQHDRINRPLRVWCSVINCAWSCSDIAANWIARRCMLDAALVNLTPRVTSETAGSTPHGTLLAFQARRFGHQARCVPGLLPQVRLGSTCPFVRPGLPHITVACIGPV